MKRRLTLFLCAATLWSWMVSTAHAAEPAPTANDGILQQELKQQQIKTTTKRVGDQLEAIIAEFDRNGISGEDVKVLRAIRGVLDKLSDKDMAKVLDFLQQSRVAPDPTAAARSRALPGPFDTRPPWWNAPFNTIASLTGK